MQGQDDIPAMLQPGNHALPPEGIRVHVLGNTPELHELCEDRNWKIASNPQEADAILAGGALDELLKLAEDNHVPTSLLLLVTSSTAKPGGLAEGTSQLTINGWAATPWGLLINASTRPSNAGEIERLQDQASHLRRRLTELYTSNRYRVGDLIASAWPPSANTLALPWKMLELFRGQQGGDAGMGENAIPPLHGANRQYRRARRELASFESYCRESGDQPVVFIFSGTTHIQEIKGNRPIRLAQAYRRQGIPVIFSYHRWKHGEKPAWSNDPGLLQLPVDLALRLARSIAHLDVGKREKIFIVGYPLPAVTRHINVFNTLGWSTIYDCRDDWEEFWKMNQARWFNPAVEAYVVRNTDVTTCVSTALVEKMQAQAPSAHVILSRNAHDGSLDRLNEGEQDKSDRVVGYVGHMASAWFDWDLVIKSAERNPDIRFELVGHSAPDSLELPANVALLEGRPMREVRKLASRWESALIPFTAGDLSRGVDPIKVYEYLALGLPVLAHGVTQVRHDPGVYLVDNHEEFIEKLGHGLPRPEPDELTDFLERNTWDARSQELLQRAAEHSRAEVIHCIADKQSAPGSAQS